MSAVSADQMIRLSIENAHLRAEFAELIDEFQDMISYVSPYFREKWGYDEALAKARAALL